MTLAKNLLGGILLTSTLFPLQTLQASGFSAAASPPRYELSATAGQKVSQVLEIYNVGNANEQYTVKTNDWQLTGEKLSFHDELLPNSCREWVKLERHKVTVNRGDKRPMRFEVDVPAGTPAQECRFALMVEGTTPAPNQIADNINLPVNGRLAVIVYLAIGGAEPALTVANLQMSGKTPALNVSNSGTAHGRLQGVLAGTDSSGKAIDFSVSSTPIMAGETRSLPLTPHLGEKHLDPKTIKYPVTLKGQLYWEKGAFAIDQQL